MNKHRLLLILLAMNVNFTGAADAPVEPPKPPLGFFVTSVGLGKGADLGGLAGADAHCQKLASGVGSGSRTWRAYLSSQAQGDQAAINARDRIGKGPWANARGTIIADSTLS